MLRVYSQTCELRANFFERLGLFHSIIIPNFKPLLLTIPKIIVLISLKSLYLYGFPIPYIYTGKYKF